MKWSKPMMWSVPALAYSLLIIYLSHQSQPIPQMESWMNWDKFLHFVEYSVWTFLWWLPIRYLNFKPVRLLTGLGIMGALFAISDEWHQSFIPGRVSSFSDWISDSLGILTILFLIYQLMVLRNMELKKDEN